MLILILFANIHTYINPEFTNYIGYKEYNQMTEEQKSAEFCFSLMYCFRMFSGPHKIANQILYIKKNLSDDKTNKDPFKNQKILLIFTNALRECVLNVETFNLDQNHSNVSSKINFFFVKIFTQLGKIENLDTRLTNLFRSFDIINVNASHQLISSVMREICILIEKLSKEMVEFKELIYEKYCDHSDFTQINIPDNETGTNDCEDVRDDKEHNMQRFTSAVCINPGDNFIFINVFRYIIDHFTLVKSQLSELKSINNLAYIKRCNELFLKSFRSYVDKIKNDAVIMRVDRNRKCHIMCSMIPFNCKYEMVIRKLLIDDSFYFHVSQHFTYIDGFVWAGYNYSVNIMLDMCRIFGKGIRLKGTNEYIRYLMDNRPDCDKKRIYLIHETQYNYF